MAKKPHEHNSAQLGNLLSLYKKKLTPPQASVEKEFRKVVAELIGFELLETQVRYIPSSRIIYLTAPSVIKSEIRQREALILKNLKDSLGDRSPTTIL